MILFMNKITLRYPDFASQFKLRPIQTEREHTFMFSNRKKTRVKVGP